MSWSAGSEIPPMFERAFMAWNKHLDEVKPGMKRPVLKRVESDILCGEQLVVDLRARREE